MFYSQFNDDVADLMAAKPLVVRLLMNNIVSLNPDLHSDGLIERFETLVRYYFLDDDMGSFSSSVKSDFATLMKTLSEKQKNDAFMYLFNESLAHNALVYEPFRKKTSSLVLPVCSALGWVIETRNDTLFDTFCEQYIDDMVQRDLEIAFARTLTGEYDFDTKYSEPKLDEEKSQLMLWLLVAMQRNSRLAMLGDMPKLAKIMVASFESLSQLYLHFPVLFEEDDTNPLIKEEGYQRFREQRALLVNEEHPVMEFAIHLMRKIAYSRYSTSRYSRRSDSVSALLHLFNQVRKGEGWLSKLLQSKDCWDNAIGGFMKNHYQHGAYSQSYGGDIAKAICAVVKLRNARFYDASQGSGSLLFFGNKPTGLGNLLHAIETSKYEILANLYKAQYPIEFWLKDIKTASQVSKLREFYGVSTVEVLSLLDDNVSETTKRAVMHDLNQTM